MSCFQDLLVTVIVGLIILSTMSDGGRSGHIHHRIHVPTKVKTVYITKFIKIPEHHHYFHEKEKRIVVDHHHHPPPPPPPQQNNHHDFLHHNNKVHDFDQHKDLFHVPQNHQQDFKGYFYK